MVLIRQSDLEDTHPHTTVNFWLVLTPQQRVKACCAEVDRSHLHAGVKARSILLVLQASLGQINGKHTGDSNQAGDPPIDQFGRQTGWEEKKKIVMSEQVEMRGCSLVYVIELT